MTAGAARITAHRPAAIRGADRILVMDRRRIIEEGNHKSLSAGEDSAYARLNTMQFDASSAA